AGEGFPPRSCASRSSSEAVAHRECASRMAERVRGRPNVMTPYLPLVGRSAHEVRRVGGSLGGGVFRHPPPAMPTVASRRGIAALPHKGGGELTNVSQQKLSPWMGGAVSLEQMSAVDLRISLRGRETRVPKQLLNRSQ